VNTSAPYCAVVRALSGRRRPSFAIKRKAGNLGCRHLPKPARNGGVCRFEVECGLVRPQQPPRTAGQPPSPMVGPGRRTRRAGGRGRTATAAGPR
jgi:hypothetical protein